MKKISSIEKEYISFIPKNIEKISLDLVSYYIDIAIDEIEDDIKDVDKEIKLNNREKICASIRNFFALLRTLEEVDYYDEDNKLLQELVILDNIYIRYFCMIRNVLNKENFKELFKLLSFLLKHYESNYNFIESKRELLEYSYKGYSCINYKDKDTILEVDEFFLHKIKEFSDKTCVKIKKI